MNEMMSGDLDIESFAALIEESWQIKRELASGITTDRIDEWHSRAISAGALGGKLCGAGGGGFLLFLAPPDRHESIRKALDIPLVPINCEPIGTQIILPSR